MSDESGEVLQLRAWAHLTRSWRRRFAGVLTIPILPARRCVWCTIIVRRRGTADAWSRPRELARCSWLHISGTGGLGGTIMSYLSA